MSTAAAAPVAPGLPSQEVGAGTVFLDAMRSEWTKIRTVRSTFWTLLAAVVAVVGIAVIASEVVVHQWSTLKAEDKVGFSSIELAMAGAFFAQLAVGVLGVLVITTEYGTGMIRATFAAVPQRRTVLGAKATVLFLLTLVVGLASSFVAFFVSQLILGTYSDEKLNASITDPHALRAVLGAGVFLALMGLLGMAVGAVLRRSAGAITALFALVFFLPGLMELLPHSLKDNVNKFLPSNAGTAIYRTVPGSDVLSPGTGMLVLCAYALAALAVAAVIVQRRDT
ncbi:MAG TPA: ABC transporter permease [Mycobacteriales bacterium]|nr:ABC transporter permease [Mycobacteriales bacterium]